MEATEAEARRVVVRIGRGVQCAVHCVSVGPRADDAISRFYVGPKPRGPRGGRSGNVVDATMVVEGSTEYTYMRVFVHLFVAGNAKVRAAEKTLAVTAGQVDALMAVARIQSYSRTTQHKIELLAALLPQVPTAFHGGLQKEFGDEVFLGARKVARAAKIEAKQEADMER